ncbi:uncharacterized protein METZ01_LOCUS513761 [marine metagenome]|uniref:Uncharacterized protein n=1 Tax=marine metagenome TaxID=408172 RepID=A0A383EVJ8_9ZZZZ
MDTRISLKKYYEHPLIISFPVKHWQSHYYFLMAIG